MAQATGFPPVSKADARILILGSMPGRPSLAANRYYANPHNAFWQIMATVYRFDLDAPYRSRLAALKNNRVALWDVVASCYREGSLDSAILARSVKVNDFAGFLQNHSRIRTVLFNGGKAEQLWTRHVGPSLAGIDTKLALEKLPSTSPAYAAMPYRTKLKNWREALLR